MNYLQLIVCTYVFLGKEEELLGMLLMLWSHTILYTYPLWFHCFFFSLIIHTLTITWPFQDSRWAKGETCRTCSWVHNYFFATFSFDFSREHHHYQYFLHPYLYTGCPSRFCIDFEQKSWIFDMSRVSSSAGNPGSHWIMGLKNKSYYQTLPFWWKLDQEKSVLFSKKFKFI